MPERSSTFVLLYVIDLPWALPETGSYLYADNTCISHKYKDFEKICFK